jgi:hypothetical protein
MPLFKPKWAAGVRKDESDLQDEGAWSDANLVRFIDERPQPIGGWEKINETPFTGRARGAHAWFGSDGAAYLAWGTASALYVLTDDGVVNDITPAGFTAGTVDSDVFLYGSGLYGEDTTIAPDPYPYGSALLFTWSLDNWGEELVAVPRGDTLYKWAPGDLLATAVTGAPTRIDFMFVTPERQVVLLGTTEYLGSYSATLCRWCDQEDYTDWVPTTANLAGEFPLSSGSKCMGGVATRGQNILWTDNACFTMQFTGDSRSVFSIRLAGSGGSGLAAPHGFVSAGTAVFWIGQDNFYAFRGAVPEIIPCPVRRDVFDNLPEQAEKTCAGWIAAFEEVLWFYTDARDNTGECSRYVSVNAKGQWSTGVLARTAWVPSGVFAYPVGFSTTGYAYHHEVGQEADGGALSWWVQSGFIDIEDGDTLFIIRRITPDFDDQVGDVTITLTGRPFTGGTETSYGPYTATTTTEKLDMRVTARQIAVKFASTAAPSFARLGALAFDVVQSGSKR